MKPATILLILGLTAPLHAGAQDMASLEQMRQAAAGGSDAAQLEMGILYEFGYNMPKNDVNALAWYLLSAEQGNALAIKRREQLMSQLKPEEVDAAKKLSQELLAARPATTTPPPAAEVVPRPETVPAPEAGPAPDPAAPPASPPNTP